ncbi:hypothetical protein F5Y18DRAFT_429907 [Xylariaceae sp. FL1019]|nr:hypothetical protein F5Y18DRAFT_429907 [Xylariaceae sp. FL1019]
MSKINVITVKAKAPGNLDQEHTDTKRKTAKMKYTRLISITNFAVASSALCFQIFVLEPWHTQLDESFEELKKEHHRVLGALDQVTKAQDRMKAESEAKNNTGILERLGLSSRK